MTFYGHILNEIITFIPGLFLSLEKTSEEKKPVAFDGSSTVTVIVDDEEATFELSGKGNSLLDATEEEGLDAPYSCRGGVCCSCKAKVMEGSASMDLKEIEFKNLNILKGLITFSLFPGKIWLNIHLQALFLWLKKVAFYKIPQSEKIKHSFGNKISSNK